MRDSPVKFSVSYMHEFINKQIPTYPFCPPFLLFITKYNPKLSTDGLDKALKMMNTKIKRTTILILNHNRSVLDINLNGTVAISVKKSYNKL